MKQLTEWVVVSVLKQAGFECCSREALEYLVAVYEDRLEAVLRTMASRTLQAGRPSATLLDILDMLYQQDGFVFKEVRRGTRKSAEHVFLLPKSLPTVSGVVFPQNEEIEEKEWSSPISTRIEKLIHIYDFMPPFPPVHTFRCTITKPTEGIGLSSRIKNRLEQSLVSESNMIKLIKTSGTLPSFVSYIHNRKE